MLSQIFFLEPLAQPPEGAIHGCDFCIAFLQHLTERPFNLQTGLIRCKTRRLVIVDAGKVIIQGKVFLQTAVWFMG